MECCFTHPAFIAVGQELVLFLGVEDNCVRGEGDGLSLEGGAFVCADEQHLIPLIYGGTHQHHLKVRERGERENRGQRWNGQRVMSGTVFITQLAVCGRCKEAALLISVLVHINSQVCTGKLMNTNACMTTHTHLFEAIISETRTFHQPYVPLWPRQHCIDYLFRVL